MEYFSNTPTEAVTPSGTSLTGTNVVTVRDVARILRRRAPIALLTFAVTVAAALFLTSKMRPTYEATTKILLDAAPASAIPSNVLELLGSRGSGASGDVEVEKIKSRGFLGEVQRRSGLVGKMEVDDLKNRIQASISNGQILEISTTFKDDPVLTAKVANIAGEVYKEYVRQDDERKLNLASGRLERAAKKAETEKDAAQKALNGFLARLGNSDPGSLFVRRANKTEEIRSSLEDAMRDLPLQEKRLALYQKQMNTIAPTIYTGTSKERNPTINGYEDELVRLEANRKLKLIDFGPESPEIAEIDADIKAKKEALAKAQQNAYRASSVGIGRNPDYQVVVSGRITAERDVAQTKNTIEALQKQLATLEAEQAKLAPQQATYIDLKQRAEVTADAYRKAKTALLQIPINQITNVPNIRTLEAAMVPKTPVSPKPLLNTILAIFGGTLLAVGVAIATEYFASNPQTGQTSLPNPTPTLPQLPAAPFAASLPAVGGVPLLARVPLGSKILLSGGVDATQPPALHASTEDAFREIGYLLSHATESGRVPVVLMAGTRTDETTASIAASLTATLVREGMRVTLVDGDRTEPRLHKVFGKPDAPGVTDILSGRITADEALHVGANGNLRFLAAGAKSDPTPLTEETLRKLYDELGRAGDTDLVVISGPSVWSARIVSPMEKAADGIVLVASDEQVAPEESVARARRILTNGYQPRLLGVIVGETAPTEASALPAPKVNEG